MYLNCSNQVCIGMKPLECNCGFSVLFWLLSTESPDPLQEIHSVDETLRQICKMNVKMTGLIPKLNELDTEAGKANLDPS